jgi:GDP-L-fucose synthase
MGEDVVGINSSAVDLRDAAATLAAFEKYRPRAVYHTAARVHGIMGNKEFPAEMFLDNIRININVIDAAYRTGCKKFIAASTVAAYPAQSPFPITEESIWNGAPHHSEEFYAHAKRAMLAHLRSYHAQYDFDYSYAILTNLYGPGDRFDTKLGHVIPSLIANFYAASKSRSEVTVWGTGAAKRDFMYADDAARALISIGRAEPGAFNIATGTTVAIRQVVELLMDITGVSHVTWDATKPDGQLDRSYETSKLKSLGFETQFSLRDGLNATYDWYSRNYPDVRT